MISDFVQILGEIFSNLSTEEGWSALGRESCHNTKQIAYQHPGGVHILERPCKDDFSKDTAQKHGALGNRSPGRTSITSKADLENCGCCHSPGLGNTYLQTYGFSHMLVPTQPSLHMVILYLGSRSHIPYWMGICSSYLEWTWTVLESWSLLPSREHTDWPEEAGRRAKNECVVSWTGHSGSIGYVINYTKTLNNYKIIYLLPI